MALCYVQYLMIMTKPGTNHKTMPPAPTPTPNAFPRVPTVDATARALAADAAAGLEDVALPPDDRETRATAPPASPSHPDHARKPKRFYYCLPMIIRYRHAVAACCLLAFAALVLSAGLRSFSNSKRGHAPVVDDAPAVADDAPRGYDRDSAGRRPEKRRPGGGGTTTRQRRRKGENGAGRN